MDPNGGLGGAALLHANALRLVLGGGGGSGEWHHAPDDVTGGAGGGIIFVRANHLDGAGRFDASGRSAAMAVGDNGAGGGGAGGTLVLRVAGTPSAASLLAQGGDGGSTRNDPGGNGPGGGGGGGLVFVRGTAGGVLSAQAGLAGISDILTGAPSERGARPTPSERGSLQGVIDAISNPAEPVPVPNLVLPARDAFTSAQPTFEGVTGVGVTVRLRIDGARAASATASASGAFSVKAPMVLAPGPHVVQAQALLPPLASEWSAPLPFVVGMPSVNAPVITAPSEGEVLLDVTPQVQGTADDGGVVFVVLDGIALAAVDATGGAFTAQVVEALEDGQHQVHGEAALLDGGRLAGPTVTFQVATPRRYGTGCGCTGSAGAALLLGALWLTRRLRR